MSHSVSFGRSVAVQGKNPQALKHQSQQTGITGTNLTAGIANVSTQRVGQVVFIRIRGTATETTGSSSTTLPVTVSGLKVSSILGAVRGNITQDSEAITSITAAATANTVTFSFTSLAGNGEALVFDLLVSCAGSSLLD